MSNQEVVRHGDVDVVRDGAQIVLPKDMDYDSAIEWLERKRDEDNETVGFAEQTPFFPLDGAVAMMRAMREMFGWVQAVPTMSFFGSKPPQMISVEVSYGVFAQAAWGQFQIPGVHGKCATSIYTDSAGLYKFQITGSVLKKDLHKIKSLADLIRKQDSLYKGKAIRMRFPEEDEDFDIAAHSPRFLDLSRVNEGELVFPDSVRRLVDAVVFTPMEKTETLRRLNVPLKRGILLEGPYGVGKTLTAYVAAKKAEAHGWTFLYLDTVKDLPFAIQFARLYAPCMIFAEDIDRTVTGERSHEMDEVLNVIDGIDTKNSEVMVVLTTNHVENINRAMLRPGRLDAVISVSAPDAAAVERLIRLYAREQLAAHENLTSVSQALEGQIPAVVREVVERSKLFSIARGGDGSIVSQDLEDASNGMLNHLRLLKGRETPPVSAFEIFGDALADRVRGVRPGSNGAVPAHV